MEKVRNGFFPGVSGGSQASRTVRISAVLKLYQVYQVCGALLWQP
jgi:hypothetical protein